MTHTPSGTTSLHAQDLAGRWALAVDLDGRTGDALPSQARALAGREIPAQVPGAVHADLLRAGLIPDPLVGLNEHDVAWVGRSDWQLSRAVRWDGPAHERLDLVLDGVDTAAEVLLGGTSLGTSRNMHRSYRYDVGPHLAGGAPRELAVRFTSAYTEAELWQRRLGDRPSSYPEPFNFVRKMACAFGWDWGPTLPTAGLWRGVRLEGWSGARLAEVRPLATHRDGVGVLELHLLVERAASTGDQELVATVLVDDRVVGRLTLPPGSDAASAELVVDGVRSWRPVGHGDAALHDLRVELADAGGAVRDRWRRRTGFRSVRLDETADADGTSFALVVGDAPVLVKGVNWIPDDIFPGLMTRERYERRLREAVAANVNLVRVWGGGVYESRDFYELCDELGLMVWQDFLFACASYPEEEPFTSEVEAEARENVARLAVHPSLVLWSGNNENLWLRGVAGWTERPGAELTWGEGYYLDLLPRVMSEVDPSRPYTAGSPWSGSWAREPNDPDHGTHHSWDVWNREDYSAYTCSEPRFVAEFGWQAPPAWATLRRAVDDEPLHPGSPGVLHHQKAEDGQGKLARGLEPHFAAPASTEAWHLLTQLNQVRAVATGLDHWRASWPRTTGAILWQLNDLWPVTSWSAIDGDGRPKPLLFALRDLYAPRRLAVVRRGGRPVLALMNDTDEPWDALVAVTRRELAGGGAELAGGSGAMSAGPRSVALAALPAAVAPVGDAADEYVVAAVPGGPRAVWFDAPDRDLALPDPGLEVLAVAAPGGLDLHVRAERLARDVLVQADRLHPAAVADRGFFTLLPGEAAVVRVRGAQLDPGRALLPWVVADARTAAASDVLAPR